MINNKIKQFKTNNSNVTVDVKLENEEIWLNGKDLANLYQADKSRINKSIKSILDSGELEKEAVTSIFTNIVNGRMYVEQYYNLEMIIKLGYRFNPEATASFVEWIEQDEELKVNLSFSFA